MLAVAGIAFLAVVSGGALGKTRAVPPPATVDVAGHSLSIEVGMGKLVRLPVPASSVFVADSSIADVQTPNASAVFVFGKKPGLTTLFALSRNGSAIVSYTVTVQRDQQALQSSLQAEGTDASVHLLRTPHALVLQGSVASPSAAATLQEFAQKQLGAGESLVNQLRVTGSVQVNLRVRVAEVSRSVTRDLGFNWNTVFKAGSFLIGLQTGLGTTGAASLAPLGPSGAPGTGLAGALNNVFGTAGGTIGTSVSSGQVSGTQVLDAMATEGLVTMLAEPNLTTTSGEPATFLAGGEYPIPISQALGVTTISYKTFGVSVGFTPTVLSDGMISMKVSPEVSALSTTGSFTQNGFTVPALTTRRAQTTVQLASGQSFAIGGLIQNNAQNSLTKVPWLGDIPVLGALFRSTAFQRNETELVIVVTAYTVKPLDSVPALPTDFVRQPSDVERLLWGQVAARAGPSFDPERMPRLRGESGFMFE
ncbi:MAG: type II and III secretion system protein family protein [Janthinobacterium lividum]